MSETASSPDDLAATVQVMVEAHNRCMLDAARRCFIVFDMLPAGREEREHAWILADMFLALAEEGPA